MRPRGARDNPDADGSAEFQSEEEPPHMAEESMVPSAELPVESQAPETGAHGEESPS